MRKNLLVLCGGRSSEHEVSIMSAKNIINAINTEKYNILLVGISVNGCWYLLDDLHDIKAINDLPEMAHKMVTLAKDSDGCKLFFLNLPTNRIRIDLAFPIMHGRMGEDGSIQGLLQVYDVPFVGAKVLGSAIGMDKEISKRLLLQAGMPVADFVVVHKNDTPHYYDITSKLGHIMFVKPANSGSSIGVTKVSSEYEFDEAIIEAFKYDDKVLVEKFIDGKEIECAVIGKSTLSIPVLGEIRAKSGMYGYDDKYFNYKGADVIVPAILSKAIAEKIQAMAIKVFKILQCQDIARVDFFLTKDEKIYVSEINTIPGFTNLSMYPRLLLHDEKISYQQLIDDIISFAIESQQ